jgi:DNA-binding beta-propeller fold protein YncE
MRTSRAVFVALIVTGGIIGLGGSRLRDSAAAGREVSPLQLVEEMPVPGVAGRIDHFTADAKRRRLIVSALGNNSVEVIDVFAGKVIQTIKGLDEPQGALYVPGLDKLFIANAGDGKVRIYDGATYTLRKTLDFGEDPDNLRYDAASKMVFVGYGGEEGGIGAIDPASGERVGSDFKTGAHPESFQVEESGGHIFVNVPDADNVVKAIDRKTGAIATWTLNGLRTNFAMTLNEADHRLYVITRKPPMMVALDTRTGKEVARVAAAGECDDVYLDAARKRIYVIGAQGFISVIQENDPDHYELVENVPSAVGVRTGYYYAPRDRVYVAVPAKGNEPAQIWTYEVED